MLWVPIGLALCYSGWLFRIGSVVLKVSMLIGQAGLRGLGYDLSKLKSGEVEMIATVKTEKF
jgi:hypothetical protein